MICRTDAGKLFTVIFILTSVPMWFSILAQMGFFLQILIVKSWRGLLGLCGADYTRLLLFVLSRER